MSDYLKHRLAKEDFVVDFADQLATGEALAGTPAVSVSKFTASTGWADVSSQFATITTATTGTEVVFYLGAAAGTNQAEGFYSVVVQCATDSSPAETLTATPSLFITAEGDPNAP